MSSPPSTIDPRPATAAADTAARRRARSRRSRRAAAAGLLAGGAAAVVAPAPVSAAPSGTSAPVSHFGGQAAFAPVSPGSGAAPGAADVSLPVGTGGSTTSAEFALSHCPSHWKSAPDLVTREEEFGGIRLRATYNYTTCRGYAVANNRNTGGGLLGAELRLWGRRGSGCPGGSPTGGIGLELASWSGTLNPYPQTGHIRTISGAQLMGGSDGVCIRATLWAGGYPFYGVQVYARRYKS